MNQKSRWAAVAHILIIVLGRHRQKKDLLSSRPDWFTESKASHSYKEKPCFKTNNPKKTKTLHSPTPNNNNARLPQTTDDFYHMFLQMRKYNFLS